MQKDKIMSMDIKIAEKRRSSIDMEDMDDDSHLEHARSPSPKNRPVTADSEKRIRREIANSNERRRMQSINAGFQSLKAIIPHQEGEKLSKAAILHQAVEYIQNLEQERTQTHLQNDQLRKRLKELDPQGDGITPPPKRKKRDTESSDEGISMNFDDGTDISELRNVLQRERHQRKLLEEKTRNLEARLNPELLRQMTSQQNQMVIATNDEKMEVDSRITKPEPAMMQSPTIATTPLPPVCGLKLPLVPMPVSAPQEIPVAKRNTPLVIASPQSKRNLEMIAEAIRHLEGEQYAENCLMDNEKESHDFRSHLGSEESQTESSNSDQEDSKSESSGRGSPVLSATRDYIPAVGGLERQTATLHVSAPPAVAPAQMLAAPGVPLANIQMLHQPSHHIAYHHQNGFIIHNCPS